MKRKIAWKNLLFGIVALCLILASCPSFALDGVAYHPQILQQRLRNYWKTQEERFLSILIEDCHLFLSPKEKVEDLKRIVSFPDRFSFNLRARALWQLNYILEGEDKGRFFQDFFSTAAASEIGIRQVVIRCLASSDDWIPFLLSLAKGEKLSGLSQEEEWILRVEAYKVLARWQNLAIFPSLIDFFEQKNLPSYLKEELPAILACYDERALPQFKVMFQFPSPFWKQSVLQAWGNKEEGVEFARRGIHHFHPEVRALSIQLLGTVLEEGAISLIQPMINDPDPQVRALACAFLASWGVEVAELELEPSYRVIKVLARTQPGMAFIFRLIARNPDWEDAIFDWLSAAEEVFPASYIWLKLKERGWKPISILRFFEQDKTTPVILEILDTQPDLLFSSSDWLRFSKLQLTQNAFRIRNILSQGDIKAQIILLRNLFPLGEEALSFLEFWKENESWLVDLEVVSLLEKIPAGGSWLFLERLADSPWEEVRLFSSLVLLKKMVEE
ncbi:MAG: hypothetical protein PWP04_1498 [Candidatus Atribacteria bacterium]|nr:hypothetical protein [Candidatus Atribacteria bacterium]